MHLSGLYWCTSREIVMEVSWIGAPGGFWGTLGCNYESGHSVVATRRHLYSMVCCVCGVHAILWIIVQLCHQT